MPLQIGDPELFGVNESGFSLTFCVEDGSGPVDAAAEIWVDGVRRAVSEGPAGTRHVEVDGLVPDTDHEVGIRCGDAAASPDPWFPGRVRTLPRPDAAACASFATLNDLHFGEPRFGGVLDDEGEFLEDRPGWDFVTEDGSDEPYWRFMNEDAVAEINAAGVDAAIIKGDIADRGRPEQFEEAARCFSRFAMPHHAFLGNHDYYAVNEGLEVDGYALLGQPRAPRSFELGGWRMVLLETAEPGHHHGVFGDERMDWLAETLSETGRSGQPTLLFMHHQPVPPQHAGSYPNSIGMRPDHSVPLLELVGANPQVRGVLIGHTHRNRVRRYAESGAAPFIEVNCTKDYPGGWGHYRLFQDGSFRQQVRRTASERALAHSTRCRGMFQGGYRKFALGTLDVRSLVIDAPRR